MKKRIILSIAIFIVSSSMFVNAADFLYGADMKNHGEKNYKAVRLTSEVYNKLSENMADIMVFDNDNEPVPYFINSFNESRESIHKSYELKLVNSFVKDDWFYYDYVLKDNVPSDVAATSIEISSSSTNFAKQLELWGSYDSTHWEKVQDDIIYNVDGSSKPEINFSGSKKYTCYRFKLFNNLEKVEFSTVTLNYDRTLRNKEYFIETLAPEYTSEEKGNTTVIKLKNMKNLKLNKVSLKTGSTFKRNVSFNGSVTKALYNLEFDNVKYRDLIIPLESYLNVKDEAEITIENNDDKPVEVSGVEVEYLVDELVFKGAETKNFTLRYGSNEINTPKSYDISNYKAQILTEGYDLLNIENINKVSASGNSEEIRINYKLIFNIIILIVAAVLGFIIIRKLKK